MPFSFDGFPTLNETDLLYGLTVTRRSYWRTDTFRNFRERNNIDSYHFTREDLAGVHDPEKISYKNEDYLNYVSNHEKYSSIQSEPYTEMANRRFYDNPSLVFGRKCKAGLGWATESDIHVNFLLDNLNMDEIVDKIPDTRNLTFEAPTTSITSRELRYLYRNRNNEKIRSNVQFWNEGKPVAPPWKSDPETWSRYKPKSEANAGANIKASAEVEQAAKLLPEIEDITAL